MENQEISKRNDELFIELKKYPEGSKEYRNLATKIVKNNERLVTWVAKRYFPTIDTAMVNPDDLIAEGYYGLAKAIKNFNPAMGVTFSSYAVPSIRNTILKYLKHEQIRGTDSLEDAIAIYKDGDKRKAEDNLATTVDIEADIVERDETKRQIVWIKKNLNQLKPFQRNVLIAKYLSQKMSVTNTELAEESGFSHQYISLAEKEATKTLKEMLYFESHPEAKAIKLTKEEEIAIKEVLKSLILANFTPLQNQTMLCKYYSATEKTNQQIADELNLTLDSVRTTIGKATKKLCTLYNGVQDKKHLTSAAIRNILESRATATAKER